MSGVNMTSRIAMVAVATLALLPFEAAAQAPPEPVSAATAVVPAGTPIRIEIAETVGTKTHKQGDTFAIRLAAPILHDGKVIVPAGVPGQGQVVDSDRAGIGGAPGKLVLAARWVEYDGKRIPVRTFRFAPSGEDRSVTSMQVSTWPYVGVVGVFLTGGEITVQPGAIGDAKLAADLPAIPAPAVNEGAKP